MDYLYAFYIKFLDNQNVGMPTQMHFMPQQILDNFLIKKKKHSKSGLQKKEKHLGMHWGEKNVHLRVGLGIDLGTF